MNGDYACRKVAFIDTNLLHFIDLYLSFADNKGLYPWKGEKPDADEALTRLADEGEGTLCKSLKRGLGAIHELRKHEVEVQYSSISELELMEGRATGKAFESAAREKVPFRMWSRISELEIQERVGIQGFREIKLGVDEIRARLENSGLLVGFSSGFPVRDVLQVSQEIGGLIYLSVMDSIIYGSALIADADYFFTNDKALGQTAKKIRSPNGNADFMEVRQVLRGSNKSDQT